MSVTATPSISPVSTRDLCVVIPALNEEKLIGRCIRSVLDAGLQPDQIVVVDDCSTDRTGDALEQFSGVHGLRRPQRLGKVRASSARLSLYSLRSNYRYLAIPFRSSPLNHNLRSQAVKPLSLVARLILTIVILAASAACGGQSPLSTLGTGPSSIDAESAASDAVSGTRALSSGNITITYAQGQDRPKSLHVQWVGDVDTCVIEVWYGRYTEDVVERIARFETDSREIHFRVPSQFVGGRYRVMICGVQSRLMYLDGKANDTTQRPVPPVTPPGNEQPTAPPVDPPVNPPSNDDDGDDESNPGPGAATGGDDAGGEDTGGGNNGGSTGGGNNGQCNASSRPQGGNNNGGGSGNTGGNTDPNPGRGCDSGNPGQGHL